ncbi:MAG TPA: 30S ribosomal protein S16 [Candidatus Paceibacterota bacterium]
MLKIRLHRIGRRNEPHYKVVVTDARKGPKSAKFIEELGYYTPKSGTVSINKERSQYWMGVGAQVSDTVHNFMVRNNIVEARTRNSLPTKKPTVKRSEAKKK